MKTFSTIKLPFSIALAVFRRFWWLVYLFSFIKKIENYCFDNYSMNLWIKYMFSGHTQKSHHSIFWLLRERSGTLQGMNKTIPNLTWWLAASECHNKTLHNFHLWGILANSVSLQSKKGFKSNLHFMGNIEWGDN